MFELDGALTNRVVARPLDSVDHTSVRHGQWACGER
jgi:hypothetical protein